MRISLYLRLLSLTALLNGPGTLALAQSLGSDAAFFSGDTIESSRPFADVADLLQARYENPIAYEDPVWEWKGDDELRDVGRDAGKATMMRIVPTRREFRLPAELTADRLPELTVSLLERVLAEYHRQNPGPRFRIVESKYGLHIVPETAYDASGRLGPARSVMDATITVPETTGTASAHFVAICQAISQTQGLRVACSAVGFDAWYENLFAAPGGTLTWGANAVTARDALADLLDHSATSFSWRLFCGPISAPYGAHSCTMNLRPIQVVRPDANGNPALVRLEYDRRKK